MSKFRHTLRLPFFYSSSSAPPSLLVHTFPSIVLSSSPQTQRHESPVVKISGAQLASDKCQLCLSALSTFTHSLSLSLCVIVCARQVLEQRLSQSDGCQKQVMIQVRIKFLDLGEWLHAKDHACYCVHCLFATR